MWYTLLFSCVQHDLTFETLQNGHHNKSSYHLSAYKVNAILLTVFSMLYFSSPDLLIMQLDVCPSWFPSPILPFTSHPFSLFLASGNHQNVFCI